MAVYGKPAKPSKPGKEQPLPPIPLPRQPGTQPPSGPGKRPGISPGSTKKKRRSPLWSKFAVAVGALLVLAGGGAMIAVPLLLKTIDNSVPTVNLLGNTGAGRPIDGAINLLMVGLDTRDSNPSLGSRADSIMIAHVPASHDRVYLISIPRDTNADLPPFPQTKFKGGSFKINASFFFGSQNGGGNAGGMQLLALTLKNMIGIQFDGGLIVNFDGFTDIVTKLGGVTMYVDEDTMSLHHGYITGHPDKRAAPWVINSDGTPNHRIPGTTPVVYTKGTHHLSAYEALDYVRCRDFLPYTDYDRQRHQQQFVKALLQEAYDQGINNPLKISQFLDSLDKAFVFDPGQSSPGHPRSTSDWIFTLKGISPSSMVTIKTNDGKYVQYTGPAPDERQALSPDSQVLMQDVVTDNVQSFIASHPDWVSSS